MGKKALGDYFELKDHWHDSKWYTGNKDSKRRALESFSQFCSWCFEDRKKQPLVIVSAGHSIWFKSFFQVYLDAESKHAARSKKIVNCGVVAFNLERCVGVQGEMKYRIDEESIATLHGGFDKTKNYDSTKLRFPGGSATKLKFPGESV